jgi:AcrR family transcriptional regulator
MIAPSAETETQPTTRDRILDAAERIVVSSGAGHLTLDAVVQEAGVSKGGLLYHFPNKEALLSAMVSRYCGEWDAAIRRKMAGTGNSMGDQVVALVDTHLEMKAAKSREVSAALLGAAATNPQLLAEASAKQAETLAALAVLPGDFPLAMVVLAAIDGLTLCDTLGLGGYTPDQREQLLTRLRELARACSPSV